MGERIQRSFSLISTLAPVGLVLMRLGPNKCSNCFILIPTHTDLTLVFKVMVANISKPFNILFGIGYSEGLTLILNFIGSLEKLY